MQHLRCEEGHIHKVTQHALSLSLSSERLVLPCLAGCSSIASQFMGMTTDRQPICLQAARGLVDGQSCKHLLSLSGLSTVSHFVRLTLHCFNAFIQVGWLPHQPEGGMGWGRGTVLHDGCAATVHQQWSRERAALFMEPEKCVHFTYLQDCRGYLIVKQVILSVQEVDSQ